MSEKNNEVLETEAVKAEKPLSKQLWVWLFAIGFILAIIVNVQALNAPEEEEATTTTTTTVSTTVATTAAAVTVPAGATVAQDANGNWALINNGATVSDFTGIASNDNGNWYVENGVVNFGYTGSFVFNGATYNIVNGAVQG